jgi:hypothetical protein
VIIGVVAGDHGAVLAGELYTVADRLLHADRGDDRIARQLGGALRVGDALRRLGELVIEGRAADERDHAHVEDSVPRVVPALTSVHRRFLPRDVLVLSGPAFEQTNSHSLENR